MYDGEAHIYGVDHNNGIFDCGPEPIRWGVDFEKWNYFLAVPVIQPLED